MALRQQLDRVKRADVKLTPAGWKHRLALLDDGLVIARIGKMPSRVQEPLAPSWKATLDLVADRHQRSHLRRLAVFCGQQQISPGGVGDDVLGAYRAHLEASLVDRPLQAHRDAVLAWNAAVSGVSGWPQVVLTEPWNRGETSLPFSAFPASFEADAEGYVIHLAGDDLLSERADRQASPMTMRVAAHTSAAQPPNSSGADAIRCPSPPCATSSSRKRRLILRRIWAPERKTPKGQTYNIGRTLLAIARHWRRRPTLISR